VGEFETISEASRLSGVSLRFLIPFGRSIAECDPAHAAAFDIERLQALTD
jgi:hypothetical protein